ncbi:MAG: hypothetical protein JWM10_2642 [Myxococcaceae bacterium]|nr:hypothetical protein [Myxococcaceae bacterium]
MEAQKDARVFLDDGVMGRVEAWQPDDGGGAKALVLLDDGKRMWVPGTALAARPDGGYTLPLGRAHLDAAAVVIPVMAERVDVGRRVVETGVVRVRKVVHEREELVDRSVTRETVRVDRVPMNRAVEGPMEPRQEGDTLVIPVVEEVLVVERRYVLKEEVRVVRQRVTEPAEAQRVTLRREEIVVERDDNTDPRPSRPH